MIVLSDAEYILGTIVSSFVWTKHRNVTDRQTDGPSDRQRDRETDRQNGSGCYRTEQTIALLSGSKDKVKGHWNDYFYGHQPVAYM